MGDAGFGILGWKSGPGPSNHTWVENQGDGSMQQGYSLPEACTMYVALVMLGRIQWAPRERLDHPVDEIPASGGRGVALLAGLA